MENGYSIGVYATYAVVAIGITAWLAHTLFRNAALGESHARPSHRRAVRRRLIRRTTL